MNFQQLCDVEQACERAVRAVRIVGSNDMVREMGQLSYIIQEVRHAGQTLCSSDQADNAFREEAVNRLVSAIFSRV
jgi:hypothetical protein